MVCRKNAALLSIAGCADCTAIEWVSAAVASASMNPETKITILREYLFMRSESITRSLWPDREDDTFEDFSGLHFMEGKGNYAGS